MPDFCTIRRLKFAHSRHFVSIFEIKLGVGYIDEAVQNLKKFAKNIDASKMDLPKSLNIITGTGMSHRRPDGINVISLASLGK